MIAAAAPVRGYRLWQAATALSALAAAGFTAWRVAALHVDRFGTVNPAWRRAAVIDLTLCVAGALVYVAVSVAGLVGLRRARPWAPWLVRIRAGFAGLAVFAASAVLPLLIAIVYMVLLSVVPRDAPDRLLATWIPPVFIAVVLYVCAAFRVR